jgi:hypothetical protein
MKNQTPQSAKEWYEQAFLPWQKEAQAYQTEKQRLQKKLRDHTAQLQTMIGLLLEGQSKRAVLAWNALGLEPALAEMVMSGDRESLLLRSKGGQTQTLRLDDLIAGLEQIQKGA